MAQPDIPPMTQEETDRVTTLEGTAERSEPENRELQLLYLHRWAWAKAQQMIVRVKALARAPNVRGKR